MAYFANIEIADLFAISSILFFLSRYTAGMPLERSQIRRFEMS